LRRHYERPAIYRWLTERDEKSSVYIGETENLVRRLTHYLKPGPSQITNKRLRDRLDEELRLGARISFETLAFDPFSINGHLYSTANLGSKEVRCFVENLLLSQLPPEIERLNRLDSMQQKAITRAAMILNPGMESDQAKALASKVMEGMVRTTEPGS
jgi:hypothetical protein